MVSFGGPLARAVDISLQPRIDVAGAGNLELVESFGKRPVGDDLFGNLAGSLAQSLGQLERQRQRKLAHLHIGRLIDDKVGQIDVVLLAQKRAHVSGQLLLLLKVHRNRYSLFALGS